MFFWILVRVLGFYNFHFLDIKNESRLKRQSFRTIQNNISLKPRKTSRGFVIAALVQNELTF